ncbi:MAG: hypothetical protein CVV18_03060 [Gammaproteobacteria bacterium HGW-Gammaproteobacteria-8]|nr:MAG: hypothetical protein CVV18_03060 [Gammaproteobacteria bacterium HGW-Gammaproteobacteria-8]
MAHPKCYVTTCLIERVSEKDLEIIIEHERAHIRNNDTRRKLLFALLASLYPSPLARRVNRLFSVATELQADAEASQSHCSLDIAQTLINVARIQQPDVGNSNPEVPQQSALVTRFVDDDVFCRVRALVAPRQSRPFPWGYCLPLVMLTLFLSTIAIDVLHHLIEAGFSH